MKYAYARVSTRKQSRDGNGLDEQIEKLKRACELHTIEHRTGDITIDICFDADRMDLLRVGIVPLPERMATKRGAELVSNPKYDDYYQKIISNL